MLSVVEKVLFLERVDILRDVPTRELAQVAMIATEETYPSGRWILVEGEPSSALYFILEGRVGFHRGGREVQVAGRLDAFGAWSLLDDEPSVVSARTLSEVFALRIDREEFLELLPDHVGVTMGVLKAVARRIRALLPPEKGDA